MHEQAAEALERSRRQTECADLCRYGLYRQRRHEGV